MRILTGQYRSKNLEMPLNIRLTQQKVRKAIFDILQKRIEGSVFLELFAGSGAVGIEALSNAALEVVFVEKNKDCLSILRKNLLKLKSRNFQIIGQDAFRAIKDFAAAGKKFDLVFLDPPYYKDSFAGDKEAKSRRSLSKKTLLTLINYDILTPDSFVIIQHHKRELLPEALESLTLYRRYSYSDNRLSFYIKK